MPAPLVEIRCRGPVRINPPGREARIHVMPHFQKAFSAVLLFLGASLAGGAAASAAGPQGVWLRDDGNARVEFAPCDDKLCATNLWIRDTSSGEEVGDKLVMTL